MATDVETLIVTLEASIKQYERQLARAQQMTVSTMRDLNSAITAGGRKVESAMAQMGHRAGHAFKEKLGEQLKEISALFLAGLGVEKLAQLVEKIAEIGDKARGMGVGTQMLQQFEHQAERTGASAETMDRAIAGVVEQLQDANSAASRFLLANKIDRTGKSTEELVRIFFDLAKAIDDPAKRLAFLGDVVGPRVARQIAAAVGDGFGQAKDDATIFTDAQIEEAEKIVAKWTEVWETFQKEVGSAILEAGPAITEFGNETITIMRAVGVVLRETVALIESLDEWSRKLHPINPDPFNDLEKIKAWWEWWKSQHPEGVPTQPGSLGSLGAPEMGGPGGGAPPPGGRGTVYLPRGGVTGVPGEAAGGRPWNPPAPQGAVLPVDPKLIAALEKLNKLAGEAAVQAAKQAADALKKLNDQYVRQIESVHKSIEAEQLQDEEQRQLAEGNMEAVAMLRAKQQALSEGINITENATAAEKEMVRQLYEEAKAHIERADAMRQAQDAQKQMQELGGYLESSVSNFADALIEGKDATVALHDALKSLATDLLHWALHQVFMSIFPEPGSPGYAGSLPAKIAQSLLGGGGAAQPSPVSQAASALFGGGGTNIGGLIGGIGVGRASDSAVGAYIAQAAAARGIDPGVALKVWSGEGKGAWQSMLHGGALGLREPSYGPFQMLKGGPGTGYGQGMGNLFERQTGLDVTDPATWKQQVDFALDQARKGGWSPWYGAKAQGITGRMGIDDAAKKIDTSAANLEQGTDGLTHSVDNLSSTMGDDVSTQIQQAADMLAKSAPQLGKMFSKLLDSMGDLVTNLANGMPNLLSPMNLGMGPAASIGSFFEHSFPMFQHGGQFKVGGAGGTDSQLVAFKATPGEEVSITPRRLAGGRGMSGVSIGGTVIHIDGSADEKTVEMLDRRIAANNYRQRKALERDWGSLSMRYQQLRG